MPNAIFPSTSDYKSLIPKTDIGGFVSPITIDLSVFQFSALEIVVRARDASNVSFTTPAQFRFNSAGLETWSEMRTVKTGAAVPVAVQSSASGNAVLGLGNLIGTDAPADYMSTFIFRIFGANTGKAKSYQAQFWHPFDGNANQNWGEVWRIGTLTLLVDQLKMTFGAVTLAANSSYLVNRILP